MTPPFSSQVVVVEPDDDVRRQLCIGFDLIGGFEVARSVTDVHEALGVVDRVQPDLITFNLGLANLAAASTLQRVSAAAPTCRVAFHGKTRKRPLGTRGKPAAIVNGGEVLSVVGAVADLASPPTVAVGLPAVLGSCAQARRLVTTACAEWTNPDADAAELVADELVTNAVRHGRGPIHMRLRARSTSIRIEVSDRSADPPSLRDPAPDAVDGRGLSLIGATAAAWGYTPSGAGKTIWAAVNSETAPDTGSEFLVDFAVGTEVEMQNVLTGRWQGGFTVVDADDLGYVLERTGDRRTLASRVTRTRVRPLA